MEILKSKNEKREKFAEETFQTIKTKVESEGKVDILLDRKDFKKSLSTPIGIGFQDFKEKYKLLTQKLMAANYDLKIVPADSFSMDNMEIKVTIKKR
jgi:hypothetical protein